MKKVSFALLFIAALAVTSCHYGEDEANKTLERNNLYKGDKADYSVNRAGEGGKINEDKTDSETTSAADDTQAEVVADH